MKDWSDPKAAVPVTGIPLIHQPETIRRAYEDGFAAGMRSGKYKDVNMPICPFSDTLEQASWDIGFGDATDALCDANIETSTVNPATFGEALRRTE